MKPIKVVAGIIIIFSLTIVSLYSPYTEPFFDINNNEVEEIEKLQSGTFEGEGSGYGGKIKVEVTIRDEEIVEIKIINHHETMGIGDAAFDRVPNRIIEKQDTDVETVTGATMSSRGVIEGVEDALRKAKKQ